MKKVVLVKEMRLCGWYKYKEGSNHEKWTNGLGDFTVVGRHNDIPEPTAKSILKMVRANPGKGVK